jgi:hypothetical protein
MKTARQQALTDIVLGAVLLLSPLPIYGCHRLGLAWLHESERQYAATHPSAFDDRWLIAHERLTGFMILLGLVGFCTGLVVFGLGVAAWLRARRGEG